MRYSEVVPRGIFLIYWIQLCLKSVVSWASQLHVFDHLFIQQVVSGLPWWSNGSDSACQCKGQGLIPAPGRVHVPRSSRACVALLSPHAKACAPQREKPPRSETSAAAAREELAATRESLRAATRTQHRRTNK